MLRLRLAVIALTSLCAVAAAAAAPPADPGAPPAERLVVGIKVTPPFVLKTGDGDWRGVSVELWRRVAEKLGVAYDFREYDLQGLIDGVARGEIDVAVAALTVTAERERRFDFSHPFFSSGLGIAVSATKRNVWLGLVERFFSVEFLQVVGLLAAVLLFVGAVVWLFERRRNAEEFGGRPREGLGSGFWWSAVTMTTVGYGDKAPRTLGGRLVALVWMFASIIIISSFTAAIASSLTVSSLASPVTGPRDLPKVEVASVGASTSAAWLDTNAVPYESYPTVADAVAAVAAGPQEAVVYDAPILRYLAHTRFPGRLEVLPGTFERQDYAFALPDGSPLRERLNQALLESIGDAWWGTLLETYLGE